MYKAPIEICRTVEDIIQKVVEETDNQVYEAVFRVGVNVEKEELIKALRYDREQYAKGYADGIKEFAERLKEQAHRCDLSLTEDGYWSVSVSVIENLVEEMTDNTFTKIEHNSLCETETYKKGG